MRIRDAKLTDSGKLRVGLEKVGAEDHWYTVEFKNGKLHSYSRIGGLSYDRMCLDSDVEDIRSKTVALVEQGAAMCRILGEEL
jgi:hypothetical protein